MLRRTIRRLGSTNRYTDGSGRKLESNDLPKDLYIPAMSNRAYPVRGEHWQPVVAGKPSPHKGNAVISGAGVVGLTVAAQFALRGWHTTVVERAPAISQVFPLPSHDEEGVAETGVPGSADPLASDEESAHVNAFHSKAVVGRYTGPLTRPHYKHSGVESREGTGEGPSLSWSSLAHPFVELEYALVTRRAMDALETAGMRTRAIRPFGVPVAGVLDHPGAYNTWLTRGLVEHHPFAVKMLSVDLLHLRRALEAHVEQDVLKHNVHVFYEHVVEAVYPLSQQVVVRRWRGSAAERAFWSEVEAAEEEGFSSPQDLTNAAVAKAKREKAKRKETSLTMSSLKWNKKFADEAVDYDLIISAEGVNSHLRDLLDVEGFAADIDMGTRWFLLRSDTLSHQHIHRWLHKRKTRPVVTAESYHIRSPAQTPITMAFPRIGGTNLFSVMVYAPRGELAGMSDEDVLRFLLPDVGTADSDAELVSFTKYIRPTPTIFCENLYNSVGLPSSVMLGDAGHNCHPFWMQGLALALEDGVNLLNQVDAYSRHFYDAIKQYSDERGTNGDALRELTDRCLHFERKKHAWPHLRLQNAYQRLMNAVFPRGYNNYYEGSTNHVYSKTLEEMLNGRGYTSFEFAEKQQAKHSAFYHIGRIYT